MASLLTGKTADGSDLRRTERFKLSKEAGPKIVELSLAAQSISFTDR